MSKVVGEAYKRASSKDDAYEEMLYLKRQGVLLPNGFRPLAPLHLKEGEEFLKMLESSDSEEVGHYLTQDLK